MTTSLVRPLLVAGRCGTRKRLRCETYHKLESLCMVGDVVFLFAGALPIKLGALRSVWKKDLSPTA